MGVRPCIFCGVNSGTDADQMDLCELLRKVEWVIGAKEFAMNRGRRWTVQCC